MMRMDCSSRTDLTCVIVSESFVLDVISRVTRVAPASAATCAGTTGHGTMTTSPWTEYRSPEEIIISIRKIDL